MRTVHLFSLIAAFSVIFAGIAFADDAVRDQQAQIRMQLEMAAEGGDEEAPADAPDGEAAPAEPDAATAADIDKYIAQLGDTDYKKRQEAYDKLHAIGRPALDKLKEALKSEDAEVRASAERLIEEIEGPQNGNGQAPAMQVRMVGGGQVRLVIVGPNGAVQQVAAVQPQAAAAVVKEYSLEEAVDNAKVKYDFIDRDEKGIDVQITKTDAAGKTTTEPEHFKNADEMKTNNEELYKKYLKAQEAGPVAQRGGLSSIPMLGKALEMRLQNIEAMQDADARAKSLKGVEDELLGALKLLDAAEQKLLKRSLKNALDFDAWVLQPACAIPGVQVRPVDESLKAQLNIKGGLLVTEVADDSPLKDILKPYDIITEVDGTAVNTVDELNAAYTKASTKEKFDAKIIRGGKEETITLTPPKPPAPPEPPTPAPDPAAPPAAGGN